MPIKLELKGLKEFQSALRNIAPAARKEFATDLKAIGKMVATDAAADMPRVTGKARRSVKVKVVANRGFEGVSISEGGTVAPYVPWLDFGGTVGRGRKSNARVTIASGGRVSVQRGRAKGTGTVVRPYIKDGRYLYPAYFRRYDDMVAATFEAVKRATTSAGLEVTSR